MIFKATKQTSDKRNPLALIGLLIFSYSHPAFAKKKIKIDGYVASEFEAESFKNGESNHLGKFSLETKRKNGVKSEFGVRFRTKDNDVLIREALVNKKFDDGWKLEFGYAKKRFGLEYETGKLNRSTVDRSPLYRRSEVFTYAGRETMLRYYKKKDQKTLSPGYSIALGHSDSQNGSIVGSWRKPLSQDWSFNYWLQLQSDHIDDGQQIVAAAMHSFERKRDDDLFQWELLMGIDPEESELRKLVGDNEKVKFAGMKFHYEQRFAADEESWWQWLGQSTMMVHDVDLPDFNSLQLLAGLNYGFEPVRMGLNLEVIGSTNRLDTKDRNFSESNAKFELIYEF